jgi:hypothetical protein
VVGRHHRPDPGVHDFGVPAWPPAATSDAAWITELDSPCPREPRGSVGWVAVLRPRLGVGGEPSPEHVHADRPGRWGCVRLQRGRNCRAWALSRRVPHDGRSGGLLRARGGDRRSCPARPGPRAASQEPNEFSDSQSARPRAEDGTHDR